MSSNSLRSQKTFYIKLIFGLAISAFILMFSSFPNTFLSSPLQLVTPTPTPIPMLVKQYFSEAEVEKLFSSPSLVTLPIHDVQVTFTKEGVVELAGMLDTDGLSRVSSSAETLSPLGYKLLQTFPATSKLHIIGFASVQANVLKVKVTRLVIAGVPISSYVLDADKLVSQWYNSFLSAHPGLNIDNLYIEKNRLYLEATVPSGFAF